MGAILTVSFWTLTTHFSMIRCCLCVVPTHLFRLNVVRGLHGAHRAKCRGPAVMGQFQARAHFHEESTGTHSRFTSHPHNGDFRVKYRKFRAAIFHW